MGLTPSISISGHDKCYKIHFKKVRGLRELVELEWGLTYIMVRETLLGDTRVMNKVRVIYNVWI